MKYLWRSLVVKNLVIIFSLILSLQAWSKTVVLLGQWHLVANQKTLDIEKSKELPQYPNQKAIYLILKEWVSKGSLNTVLAEGCEGREIDNSYAEAFQGWSYQELAKKSEASDYDDVTTHVPLKLEAKFKDKVYTQCADSEKLIKQHQLIFSELRAYVGFFSRLYRHQTYKKVFNKFHKSLEEIEKRKVSNPIEYTKKKVLSLIADEEKLLLKRNQYLVKQIEKSKAKKLALVIGNRHVKNLKQVLEKKGHTVLIPELLQDTLPQNDLISQFKQLIQEK